MLAPHPDQRLLHEAGVQLLLESFASNGVNKASSPLQVIQIKGTSLADVQWENSTTLRHVTASFEGVVISGQHRHHAALIFHEAMVLRDYPQFQSLRDLPAEVTNNDERLLWPCEVYSQGEHHTCGIGVDIHMLTPLYFLCLI
jgi:hypothetical protein